MFDINELKAIQGFLNRVQLSAKEAETFIVITSKIRSEIQSLLLKQQALEE